MFKPFIAKLQLGKQGVTPSFIQSVATALKNRKQIRISVLSSTGRTRETMKETAETIISQMSFPCSYKIIGFTIVVIKNSLNQEK